MSNKATALLREQFKQGHEFLEGTMQGVTSEMAHWPPPGKAQALGANYAHVLISEDFLVIWSIERGRASTRFNPGG